ncbi:hypothetical protein [Foetidibacter luteolus]|uniref:hypothetical protein n=1 Tax=Foetidibacter luteolus TaxID=2608880 RepID=UPI00129B6E15|nr:hypothetical protein [Foetidibacter luteolus]
MKSVTLFLLLLTVTAFSFSQNVPGPYNGNSFVDLTEKRSKLLAEIPELQNQIAALGYMADTMDIQNAIADYNNGIEYYEAELKKKKEGDTSIAMLQGYIRRYRDLIKEANIKIENAKKLSVQKDFLVKRSDTAKALLSDTEYKLNQLMIPKISQQNFLFWASMAFVLLMGVLLLIFFFVVRRDEKVRFSIFGSDSGLQFVSLFSIVIAIIIFGLTGILEGKELSALLGSVAGYILGKAKFSGKEVDGSPKPSDGNTRPNPQVPVPAPAPIPAATPTP